MSQVIIFGFNVNFQGQTLRNTESNLSILQIPMILRVVKKKTENKQFQNIFPPRSFSPCFSSSIPKKTWPF